MNTSEALILSMLLEEPFSNQRELAARAELSVGGANQALRTLREKGLLDNAHRPTQAALALAEARRPRRAVILAAGFGMRMVPINRETPKALLEVRGEILIERQIRQLHEAGIREIAVVAGFMKERFEYLIDTFGVTLIVNNDYARRNNLSSLALVSGWLDNCYILPCDIYTSCNPFRRMELRSWYMVSAGEDPESTVRVNRKGDLIFAGRTEPRNRMIGIAYLTAPESSRVRENLLALASDPRFENTFWEEALRDGNRMLLPARVVSPEEAMEINTYEQLREIDSNSNHLQSDAIGYIASALSADPAAVTHIQVLKKGMTNRSFLFSCRGKRYIMRIPGEGTDRLIDRKQEAEVYRVIRDQQLSDRVIAIHPENGYKITEFVENARVCDPENPEDVRRCMAFLRGFHLLGLKVDHVFDLFGQIEFYESLWEGAPSVFGDYARTKADVLSLKPFLEKHRKPFALTHIDAVPDNFLLSDGEIRLIDWEYAGMQDQDVDLAMFCIYSLYDRTQCDALIDAYYPEGCPEITRIKIYAYIAVCGLLWSNWCEFKRAKGVEFGEYALRQYRYAKDYFRLVQPYLAGKGGD